MELEIIVVLVQTILGKEAKKKRGLLMMHMLRLMKIQLKNNGYDALLWPYLVCHRRIFALDWTESPLRSTPGSSRGIGTKQRNTVKAWNKKGGDWNWQRCMPLKAGSGVQVGYTSLKIFLCWSGKFDVNCTMYIRETTTLLPTCIYFLLTFQVITKKHSPFASA